jgi:hypothetical protein
MRGDYIECGGPRTEPEFLDELVRLLHPVSVRCHPTSHPTLALPDQRTVLFLDIDPDGGAPPVVAISDRADDDIARHAAARAIYDALATGTTWRLRWSSDSVVGEVAGPDGLPAASHTRRRRLTAVPMPASTPPPATSTADADADADADVDVDVDVDVEEWVSPVDLLAVRADEQFLDLLSVGRSPVPGAEQGLDGSDIPRQRQDRQLFALLEALRSDVESEPFPELLTLDAACEAIAGQQPRGHRGARLMPAVVAAAVFVLVGLSGVVLVATRAEPGDPLWGLSAVVDSSRATSVRAAYQVGLAITAAREALAQGRASDARRLISTVRPQLALIQDPQRKDELARESISLLLAAARTPQGQPVATGEHGTDPGHSQSREPTHHHLSNPAAAIRAHTTPHRPSTNEDHTPGVAHNQRSHEVAGAHHGNQHTGGHGLDRSDTGGHTAGGHTASGHGGGGHGGGGHGGGGHGGGGHGGGGHGGGGHGGGGHGGGGHGGGH